MGQHNPTTNAGKNYVDRPDLWATGHFDFLLKPGISDKYRKRIMAIKEEAMKSFKQPSSKYPSDRK